ncbi:uroporphyrinogen-III synthase [Lentilitoribacter sp. Alg239-R112]|uniref:uroporphyrinogen-III synthase n=1 Tax=Lentilitoribacter sp. Alg239-R112 TaxID=2305987 RepID=UPI0013A6ABB5|nr:uroporphyrinogen-III synthase [Lentilitoribacter sp. Alg239-R112]
MRVLITRPEPSASATASKLLKIGHTPITFPMSRRECVEISTQTNLHSASAFIFTSANAVHCFKNTPISNPELLSKLTYVVGDKTKGEALKLGFNNIQTGTGNGQALAELIVRDFNDRQIAPAADTPLIYLTAENRTSDLEETLAKNKLPVTPIIIYEMITHFSQAQFISVFKNNAIDIVLFYSQSAVRRFFAAINNNDPNLFTSLRYGCLSKEIASAIPDEFSNQIDIAIEPKEHHLLACIGN